MNSPAWEVVIETSAKKGWAELSLTLQETVRQELVREPRLDPSKPKARRHLKGRHDCNWEYRDLPHGKRIYYSVDDGCRELAIYYCGKHP